MSGRWETVEKQDVPSSLCGWEMNIAVDKVSRSFELSVGARIRLICLLSMCDTVGDLR
jgi:hypothetical protein